MCLHLYSCNACDGQWQHAVGLPAYSEKLVCILTPSLYTAWCHDGVLLCLKSYLLPVAYLCDS